jgi:capsid protein
VLQWQLVIPTLCQRVWDWFCEAAYLAGEIDTPEVAVEWDPPRFESADPYKDAIADRTDIRNGTRSWQEVVAARGRNPDDVLREITEFNAKVDANKIVLDSDPRKTSNAGLTQARPPGTELPSAVSGEEEDERLLRDPRRVSH